MFYCPVCENTELVSGNHRRRWAYGPSSIRIEEIAVQRWLGRQFVIRRASCLLAELLHLSERAVTISPVPIVLAGARKMVGVRAHRVAGRDDTGIRVNVGHRA